MFIDSVDDLPTLHTLLSSERVFVNVIPTTIDIHPLVAKVACITFHTKSACYVFCCPEHLEATATDIYVTIINLIDEHSNNVAFLDKKSSIQLLRKECARSRDIKTRIVSDIGRLPETMSDYEYYDTAYILDRFSAMKKDLSAIPAIKLLEASTQIFESNVRKYMEASASEEWELFSERIMIPALATVERNGLKVDEKTFRKHFEKTTPIHVSTDGFVYTQYNTHTITGRPSCKYEKVNYAALNKADGSRSAFVSRFGSDGRLVVIDFEAFHPRLIATLVGYAFPSNVYPYKHLAAYYFDSQDVSPEDVKLAKEVTFAQIYDTISQELLKIPYFNKIQEFRDALWKKYRSFGEVSTPIYKKRITSKILVESSESKLFNYLLQAMETEVAMTRLATVVGMTKSTMTKPVLYNYDSIMLDVHRSEKVILDEIVACMHGAEYPVKVSAGKNMAELTIINRAE